MAYTDPTHAIHHLYKAEYGDLVDIVMRTVGIILGGILLYIYTKWPAAYIWGIVFAIVHGMQWTFLRSKFEHATDRDTHVAGAFFVLVHVSFIWMPAYLASLDDPALMLVGMFVLVATAMFHLRRADAELWLVDAQIAVFGLALVSIALPHLLRTDVVVVKMGIVLVTIMAVAYIALTMRGAHRQQLEILEAAERLAQEQKLSAIGRLAGGIAHDFNNILTVIKGNLELHDHLPCPEEKAAALIEAQLAADRAAAVVHQLLVYARKAPSRKSAVDVNDLLSEATPFVRTLLPERVALTCTPHQAPLILNLDEKLFMTALLNLVSNALDATPESGALSLEIGTEEIVKSPSLLAGGQLVPGRYATLRARDTGEGINPEILARVADPFFTTKDPGKGTGLGLSLVSGFVEDLSGGMGIESSPKGTCVTLYLPLENASVAA